MPPITYEQLNEVRKDYDRQIDDLKLVYSTLQKETYSKIEGIQKQLGSIEKNKVGYKTFWAVLGLLVSVFGVVVSIAIWFLNDISQEIRDVNQVTTKTQVDVSFIQGKLQAAEVTNK